MSEWGNLVCGNTDRPDVTSGSEPAEVKHLSKRRNRERKFIPLVAASEQGEAQTEHSTWFIKAIIDMLNIFRIRKILGKSC